MAGLNTFEDIDEFQDPPDHEPGGPGNADFMGGLPALPPKPPRGAADDPRPAQPGDSDFMGPVQPGAEYSKGVSGAAADFQPGQGDSGMSGLFPTKEDYQQAADQKRKLAFIGAVTNTLANQQSVGNFATGHFAPKQDITPFTNALAQQADQPILQKQAMLKQEFEKPEVQFMRQAMDPNSDLSKASAQAHATLLDTVAKAYPGMAESINALKDKMSGMSQYDQTKLMDATGLSKMLGSDAMGMARLQYMQAMNGARLAQGQQRVDMQKDNQANSAAQSIDKDPLVKQYNTQIGQIGKALGLLNAQGPMTHQTASELAQDLGTVLNNGRAAGLGQTNKQEYDSASGALASAQQWLTGNPQDALPEPLKQQLRDQFARLQNAVVAQRSAQVGRAMAGRGYQHNPQAQAALSAAAGQYSPTPEQGTQQPAPAAPTSKYTAEDRDALKWANANPDDPKSARILQKLLLKGKQ